MQSRHPFEVLFSIKKDSEDPYTFNEIVKILENSPSFYDPFCKIRIDQANGRIEIGCTLLEIEASFPAISKVLVGRKRLTEENLSIYTLGVVINHSPNTKLEKELQIQATKELHDFKNTPARTKDASMGMPVTQEGFLQAILQNQPGLVLGESHSDASPKRLLIDNMATLKKMNVKYLFLEHIMKDTQGEMLNYFLASPDNEMPAMLKDYLQNMDKNYRCTEHAGFYDLVCAAKQAGITIVPFDTKASYSTPVTLNSPYHEKNRYLMMNYLAKKEIAAHPCEEGERFVVFCGSGHVNTRHGVPGVANLLGVSSVVLEDNGAPKDRQTANNHATNPDILVYMDAQSPGSELIVSLKQSAPSLQTTSTLFAPSAPVLQSAVKKIFTNELADKADDVIKYLTGLGATLCKFNNKPGVYIIFANNKTGFEDFINGNPLVAREVLRKASLANALEIKDFSALSSWIATQHSPRPR